MSVSAEVRRASALRNILPVDLWRDLAQRVRRYKPDVIVLVARKMPRIREALDLDLYPGAIEIADLAIPFSHNILNKARVAVVDDVINRGTTVQNARKQVIACGASDTAVFALAKTERAALPEHDVQCARETPLDDVGLKDLASRVPEALRLINKPFDLGFPVIPCSFAVPFRRSADIYAWLAGKFGPEALHNPTVPLGQQHRLSRFSVDMGTNEPGIRKIRLYVDEQKRLCNLVPFDVASVLLDTKGHGGETDLAGSLDILLQEALAQAPAASMLWPGEAQARANLFVQGVRLGLDGLKAMQGLFVAREQTVFSVSDACWAFGPVVKRMSSVSSTDSHSPAPVPDRIGSTSPFVARCREFDGGRFLENVRRASPKGLGALGIEILFAEFFNELSRLVGAADHKQYAVSWPYSKVQVNENPYLRLRIGPTFDDLVTLMDDLLGSRVGQASLRPIMSDLLDRFIDEGVAVPTIALYEGSFYRVYRKGENDHRDKAVQRTLLALDHLGRPISRTRLAKILTILTYSSRVETCLIPSTEARGNVSVFQSDLLSREAEITRYLRDAGYMTRAQGQRGTADA